jgi:hypothetical protein
MGQFASDTFSGTDGTELSAYNAAWSKATATGDILITDVGRIRASTTTQPRYVHSGAPASADYSVSADMTRVSTAGTPSAGVIGRAAAAGADSQYQAVAQETSGSIEGVTLNKRVTGANTQLGRDTTVSLVGTNNIVLDMNGTTIDLYWAGGGSPTISVTDSAISAAGFPGVMFNNSSAPVNTSTYHLDNFSADEVTAAASMVPRRGGARFTNLFSM